MVEESGKVKRAMLWMGKRGCYPGWNGTYTGVGGWGSGLALYCLVFVLCGYR